MRKIHMTRNFFEAIVTQGPFFEKNKKHVFRYGPGECLYEISGLYRLATRRWTNKLKLGTSSTGCTPHLDFDNSPSPKPPPDVRTYEPPPPPGFLLASFVNGS